MSSHEQLASADTVDNGYHAGDMSDAASRGFQAGVRHALGSDGQSVRQTAITKLAALPINAVEQARILGLLDALCGYLGSPGYWGYGTRLGWFTSAALQLRAEVRADNAEERTDGDH